MSFFNWGAADGKPVVSQYFWIYPILAITITAIVVGTWLYFTRRRRGIISRSLSTVGSFNEKLPV
jgi:hypothetical protein